MTKHTPEGLPSTTFARVSEMVSIPTGPKGDPHPFVVGARHVAYAADHCAGVLDETALAAIDCAQCRRPLYEHTTEQGAVIEFTAPCTRQEVGDWLFTVKGWAEDNGVDGFALKPGEFSPF